MGMKTLLTKAFQSSWSLKRRKSQRKWNAQRWKDGFSRTTGALRVINLSFRLASAAEAPSAVSAKPQSRGFIAAADVGVPAARSLARLTARRGRYRAWPRQTAHFNDPTHVVCHKVLDGIPNRYLTGVQLGDVNRSKDLVCVSDMVEPVLSEGSVQFSKGGTHTANKYFRA